MIRINLVGEARKPVVAKPTRAQGPFLEELFGGENAAAIWLGLAATIALIVGGIHWWGLRGEIQGNQSVIVEKQRRVNELKEIIARVEAYERQEDELKKKIEVITQLKDNQRGPVEMMDVVSRALPELLWVDRLDQKGEAIQIDGRSFNMNAVRAFVLALDNSEFFTEPELKDTNLRGDVYLYRITLVRQRTESDETGTGP